MAEDTGAESGRAYRQRQFGEILRRARGMAGLTVMRAAEQAGLSRSRWTIFETHGIPDTVRPQTLGMIERVFDWSPGSIEDYFRGGPEPTQVQHDVLDLDLGDRARLVADVRRELSRDDRRELRRMLLQLLAETEGD